MSIKRRLEVLEGVRKGFTPEEMHAATRLTCETGELPPESRPNLRDAVMMWRRTLIAMELVTVGLICKGRLPFAPTLEDIAAAGGVQETDGTIFRQGLAAEVREQIRSWAR